MMPVNLINRLLMGKTQADRVVPPSGFTAQLTLFASGAMCFLAVFVLAFSLTTGRIADRWSAELARSSTVRISAPDGQMAVQTEAALRVLETTPGVASARALTDEEERALLEPWFGADFPVDALPVPQLIEVIETDEGYDAEGLRFRLAGEAPGAVLDDHSRWRRPLVTAAGRLRMLGGFALILICAATAAMIALAARSALAANLGVIGTLRLVGAEDHYIARAFVRRFTLRAIAGGGAGTLLGLGAILLLPSEQGEGGFLPGLGFQGATWLWPLLIPLLAGVVAFVATRLTALNTLKGLP